uniref:Uncharacterized protein n=1 Tax=Nelumbo nucifera TaxID=4432 RepID=A0A822Y7I8_NELNU|nr:TPA_asm: hypothetical protein HUJ06_028634 [Nelumbo nucifera]
MITWHPPEIGSFKFNFDECFMGNPGQLGDGDAVRDATGTIKISFCGAVDVSNSLRDELLEVIK